MKTKRLAPRPTSPLLAEDDQPAYPLSTAWKVVFSQLVELDPLLPRRLGVSSARSMWGKSAQNSGCNRQLTS